MRRTGTDLREDLDSRIAELERRNPEWRSWLRLLRELRRVLDDPAGGGGALAPDTFSTGDLRREDAPLLDGCQLRVDGKRWRRLVHRLAETATGHAAPGAASLAGYRPSADDALRVIEAAIRQDRAGIEALAGAAGVDPKALETVAQLAAVPLLHACARRLADRNSPHWPHGYCPICAGWPILAELRGLDRSRRLRCGRCGGDWRVAWLSCPYCGETQHERLGSLVPEDELETRKVETCATCQGYLKSVTSLQAIPPIELFLRDLETVELDVVAVDRGYARPPTPGYALDLRVTPRPSRSFLRFGRR